MPLKQREADLDKFPAVLPERAKHISIGDLHGNTLKFIYTLIEEGVLSFDESRYEEIKDIYSTPVNELIKEQLDRFEELISQAQVNNQTAITLIGDELADRGSNDYFTLLLLKKLRQSNVTIDILLSNHSVEFIRDYERPNFTGVASLGYGQGQSLNNMYSLISSGLIDESDVRQIVEESYKPMLKAINYSLSDDGQFTIYTHAPVGLETIESLAKKWGIEYKDHSTRALAHTIDQINEKMQELSSNKQLAAQVDREMEEGGENPSERPVSAANSPLARLVWNRFADDTLKTKTSTGQRINFVHGHVGDEPVEYNGKILSTHTNVDRAFGKHPLLSKTGYNYTLRMDITHATHQSNDLFAHELTDAFWDKKELVFLKNHYNHLCDQLDIKLNELRNKGTKGHALYNKRYENAGKCAKTLSEDLKSIGEEFFKKPVNQESIKQFNESIHEKIETADKVFSKHRSIWHGENPLVVFVKGVIGILLSLTIAPVLLLNKYVKGGYQGVFFKPPPTDSSEQVVNFEKEVDVLVNSIDPKLFS